MTATAAHISDVRMNPVRRGTSDLPHRVATDPEVSFLAKPLREAVANLRAGLARNEPFLLLTGHAGAGKTTVARRMLEELDPRQYALGGIFCPSSDGDALLSLIVQDFGVQSPGLGDLFLTLEQFVQHWISTDREAVLVIDEAQALDVAALRQLWQLVAPAAGGRRRLHVVLVAQQLPQAVTELIRDGRTPPIIGTRCHLRPLVAAETREFVLNRLRRAGATGQPAFGDEALDAIHERSGGVPRRISMLCDRILMFLAMEGRRGVGAQVVAAVDAQLRSEWSGSGLSVPEPLRTVDRDLSSAARTTPTKVETPTGDELAAAHSAAARSVSPSDARSHPSAGTQSEPTATARESALAGTISPLSWGTHWPALRQGRLPARLLAAMLLLVFVALLLGLAVPWLLRATVPAPTRDLAAQGTSMQVPDKANPRAEGQQPTRASPAASVVASTAASTLSEPGTLPSTPSAADPPPAPATAQTVTPASAACNGPADTLGLCDAATAAPVGARAEGSASAPVAARPQPPSCIGERAALGLCDSP
jgi:general secretion pathway protein A